MSFWHVVPRACSFSGTMTNTIRDDHTGRSEKVVPPQRTGGAAGAGAVTNDTTGRGTSDNARLGELPALRDRCGSNRSMISALAELFAAAPSVLPSGAATVAEDKDHVIASVNDEAEWEAQLLLHPFRNIYMSWNWGEYRSRLGWRVERLLVRDKRSNCLGMVQLQRRRKFGLPHVYIHGGPLLFTADGVAAERMLAALLTYLDPGRLGFVVVNYDLHDTPTERVALLANKFDPVLPRAYHTIMIDMAEGLDVIRKRLHRNRAQQLRKALANERLSTRILTDLDERRAAVEAFAGMYARLAKRKGFAEVAKPEAFCDTVLDDPRIVVLEARDGDRIGAVRIAHVGADRLTDFYVASDEEALSNGLNTLAVWRMLEHTVERGLRCYDAGGIDPRANPGVFRFKRGLGGDVVQSGPLWLYAGNTVIKSAVHALLMVR